jgi:SAM-dependent methyltransferase
MDYEFEKVNCNLCNSDDYQVISDKGKFNFPTHVVICKKCGLAYLNPRWNHKSYLKFYQYEYDKYYRPQVLNGNLRLNKENSIYTRLSKVKLIANHPRKILDIGSGEGNNLIFFKSNFQDSELFAIEPSIESQNQLKRNNVTVIGSDVESSWNANYKNTFDLIIMRHVLEHFLNPVEIIKKVRSVLSNSGIVYIAVPNNLNPTQPLEKSWFRNVHTYYFNKYSLENLNNLVGLETLTLIEGDEFNKGEVYLIARKSNQSKLPGFSTHHYQEQLQVFNKKMKFENSILYKGISFIKKIAGKVLSLK